MSLPRCWVVVVLLLRCTVLSTSYLVGIENNSTNNTFWETSNSSTNVPSSMPSGLPSGAPSHSPSLAPSARPTSKPSGAPTVEPSVAPTTTIPSASPTMFPTPVYITTFIIDISQTITNCSAQEYKNTRYQSDQAFRSAVLNSLEFLPDASVNILSVVDASPVHAAAFDQESYLGAKSFTLDRQKEEGHMRGAFKNIKATTVTYIYSVIIESAGFTSSRDAFAYATTELESSVASEQFTTLLQTAAFNFGSIGLLGAATSVDGLNIHPDYLTVNGSPKPSSQPTHSTPEPKAAEGNSLEIIGPALALVLLFIFSLIVYFRFIRTGDGGDSFMPVSQDSEGYDEIELMEKKAQMVSLTQHGTNPLHRLKKKNRKNNGYSNLSYLEDDSLRGSPNRIGSDETENDN